MERIPVLVQKQVSRFRLGVFGRAFFTLFFLLLTSLSAWLFAFLVAQQEPRATQIAERAVTAYYITQRAFRFAPKEKHPALLMELATIGDTQAFPRERHDHYTPLPQTQFWQLVSEKIRLELTHDEQLILAHEVNDNQGLWLSLQTEDGENYWLLIRYQSLFTDIDREWIYWSLTLLILSLVGSSIVTFLANKPLKQVSQTIESIRRGESPIQPLPENTGPRELRNLFADINTMVADRQEAENDRRVMLAGISHDLRTPLARMRLELELCHLPPESLKAIDEDLTQVNHCINQLLEYTRPASPPAQINVSRTLQDLCRLEAAYTQELRGDFHYDIHQNLYANISEVDLKRIVSNLIENARRYGRSDDGKLAISLKAYRHHLFIYIDISDTGKGIIPEEIPRILRPFSRGEQARTGVNGSGLGLAICERLLKQVGGRLTLLANKPSGLLCRIEISLSSYKNIQLDEPPQSR